MSEAASMESFAGEAARWRAVGARDGAADGAFVFSVQTTGIYCRPSCPARRARRENVRFHASWIEAERAGFRACKRCRPNESEPRRRLADIAAAACRAMEAARESAREPPSLSALARAAGLSRFHFQRLFKAATGVTPKAYADAGRAARMRAALDGGAPVTRAIYEAGFNASSRYYAGARDALGMTASQYRAGGAGTTIWFALGECALGSVLAAATAAGVCAVEFGEDRQALIARLRGQFGRAELIGDDAAFARRAAEAIAAAERSSLSTSLPRDIRRTAFELRIRRALALSQFDRNKRSVAANARG